MILTIIDAHTHFYPENVANAPSEWAKLHLETYWAELVGKRADGKLSLQGFPDEKKFLMDMDAAGVERAIIQGWYWENAETCDEQNAEIERVVARHSDRLSAFASVQPADGKRAASTAKRAWDAGFIGVGEIHDGVQKFSYGNENFAELAKICEELHLPICVHLTERSERTYGGKVATDFDAAFKAAEKFADTNFIFAHWFGSAPFEENGEGKFPRLKNVYCDSAATPLLRIENPWKLAAKIPNKAIYGSDYPLRLYPKKFKSEEMATIVDEARANTANVATERFFNKNIQRIVKCQNIS